MVNLALPSRPQSASANPSSVAKKCPAARSACMQAKRKTTSPWGRGRCFHDKITETVRPKSAGDNPPLGLQLPTAADRCRRGGWSPEQPFEERRTARREATAIAGEAHARRQDRAARRLAVARLRVRNHALQVPRMR